MASLELKLTIICKKIMTIKTPDTPEIKVIIGNDIFYFPLSWLSIPFLAIQTCCWFNNK